MIATAICRLYVFCGRHLLAAKLRRSNIDASAGTVEEVARIGAEQRSAVFGFVDRISTRVIALEPIRSTLVAYSRSQVGYWDLGANRRRLQLWLTKLKTRAGVSG
jgi:uncharacterized protein (DUF1499 family)